jgi:DNA-directed RNA polymerase alpha subunit
MNENLIKHNDFLVATSIRFIENNSKIIGERNCDIILRYFSGESMDNIAKSENLTKERIRQLIEQTKRKITSLAGQSNIEVFKQKIIQLEEIADKHDRLQRTVQANSLSTSTPLSSLKLSARAMNILSTGRIESIEDLSALWPDEIMRYRNAGHTTVSEIESALEKIGLGLGGKIIANNK